MLNDSFVTKKPKILMLTFRIQAKVVVKIDSFII